MKTKNKKEIKKTTVEELREIRNSISLEIQNMTAEQLIEYFSKKKTLHPSKDWKNDL